jgi:hypothetical protein
LDFSGGRGAGYGGEEVTEEGDVLNVIDGVNFPDCRFQFFEDYKIV